MVGSVNFEIQVKLAGFYRSYKARKMCANNSLYTEVSSPFADISVHGMLHVVHYVIAELTHYCSQFTSSIGGSCSRSSFGAIGGNTGLFGTLTFG